MDILLFNTHTIHVVLVKVDENFPFENHLYLLNNNSINCVKKYFKRFDKVRSFFSELLKYNYLANYYNLPLKEIEIILDENARPYLKHKPLSIDFNVSHCENYVVIAMTRNARIGIDIEEINYKTEINDLANIVFSDSEKIIVKDKPENFFLLWSKKESLIKAIGAGFLNDLYKETNLDLCLYQEVETSKYKAKIVSKLIDNKYYFSLCVLS